MGNTDDESRRRERSNGAGERDFGKLKDKFPSADADEVSLFGIQEVRAPAVESVKIDCSDKEKD